MRSYPALIATVLLLSGCSGFDTFLNDTVTLPGSNPEAPIGSSENMDKVKGNVVASTPILPQGGNIWPSRPPALPTLSDVANDEKGFSLSDYSRATGADLDSVKSGNGSAVVDFPEDGQISAGEYEQIKKGVASMKNGVLPDHIDDQSHKFINKSDNKSVIIPNGDGTSTVISPLGVVSNVPDSKLPKNSKQADVKNGGQETNSPDQNMQNSLNKTKDTSQDKEE